LRLRQRQRGDSRGLKRRGPASGSSELNQSKQLKYARRAIPSPGHYFTVTAAYEGADECADGGPVGGTDKEASSIFACSIAKKFQPRAMISLRASEKQNKIVM
jgi:hypothetical protein